MSSIPASRATVVVTGRSGTATRSVPPSAGSTPTMARKRLPPSTMLNGAPEAIRASMSVTASRSGRDGVGPLPLPVTTRTEPSRRRSSTT